MIVFGFLPILKEALIVGCVLRQNKSETIYSRMLALKSILVLSLVGVAFAFFFATALYGAEVIHPAIGGLLVVLGVKDLFGLMFSAYLLNENKVLSSTNVWIIVFLQVLSVLTAIAVVATHWLSS